MNYNGKIFFNQVAGFPAHDLKLKNAMINMLRDNLDNSAELHSIIVKIVKKVEVENDFRRFYENAR